VRRLPAIYGKASDEDQRCSIAACFIHPEGSQGLIVTSDVKGELRDLFSP
jgi:hypothetical protein